MRTFFNIYSSENDFCAQGVQFDLYHADKKYKPIKWKN